MRSEKTIAKERAKFMKKPIPPERLTKANVDRYFEADFLGRQQTTIRAHRLWLGRFIDHVGNNIDAQSYAGWVRHSFATWGDRTARNFAVASAARFLAWCERQRLIEKSPHRLVRFA